MSPSATIILTAALLPAVILLIIILIRDKEHPEPAPLLAKGVFYGVLSVFGSFLISFPLISSGLIPSSYDNGIGAVLYAFGAAALPEEASKLFFLWLLLRKNPYFDEYFDGIVYAVCIGLGFAGLENIMYVFQSGDAWAMTAIMRALLAVPAHFFFAVIMGYYFSLVHFGRHSRRNKVLVLLAPVLAHGIYDGILMSLEVTPQVGGFFAVALLLFCNEMRKLCTRHIQSLKAADENQYDKFYTNIH